MPDQGSVIAGLKARIADLESRGVKLESQLRLQQHIKVLKAQNKELREKLAERLPPRVELYAEKVKTLEQENSSIRLHNITLAARVHQMEKKLAELGVVLPGAPP